MTVVANRKGGLMARSDPEVAAELVQTTPAELAEMRGQTMRGWVELALKDINSDDELLPWIERAGRDTSTFPPKD